MKFAFALGLCWLALSGCRCDTAQGRRTPPTEPKTELRGYPIWDETILSRQSIRRKKGDSCSPHKMLKRCKKDDRSPRCEWTHWALGSPTTLLGQAPEAVAAHLLKRSVPKLNGPLPLPVSGLEFKSAPHPPYRLTTPIDWAADPYRSKSWRRQFQNLQLVSKLVANGSEKSLDQAAYLVLDWSKNALRNKRPPDHTWESHAMTSRAANVRAFLDAYLNDHTAPNRKVVDGALSILLSHTFAFASSACYVRGHNHGLFEDRTLLKLARELDLPSKDVMSRLAEKRALEEQILLSINKDGIQVENSTSYAIGYSRWASQIANRIWLEDNRPLPQELVTRLSLLHERLPYLLQPEVRGPAFGDTRSARLRSELKNLLRSPLKGTLDQQTRSALEYLLGKGPPPELPPTSSFPKAGTRPCAADGRKITRTRSSSN